MKRIFVAAVLPLLVGCGKNNLLLSHSYTANDKSIELYARRPSDDKPFVNLFVRVCPGHRAPPASGCTESPVITEITRIDTP